MTVNDEATARRERAIASALDEWPSGLRGRHEFVKGVLLRGEAIGAVAKARLAARVAELERERDEARRALATAHQFLSGPGRQRFDHAGAMNATALAERDQYLSVMNDIEPALALARAAARKEE